MTTLANAVLPWLSGPLQWVVLVAAGLLIVASWVAVFAAIVDDLPLIPATAASTLSVLLGIGVLALGRLGAVQLAQYLATAPERDASTAAVFGGGVLVAAEVAAGAALLMGFALEWAIAGMIGGTEETATAFRVIVGAGLALWVVHEIVLMVHIAHGTG